MKRFALFIPLSFFLSESSFANHISGGEIYYTCTPQSGNAFLYHITLKLLRECDARQSLNGVAKMYILNKRTFEPAWEGLAPRARSFVEYIHEPNPCITNPPDICYEVGFYEIDVLIPPSPDGYNIIYENCCKPSMANLRPALGPLAAAFFAEIPGTKPVASGPLNNSPKFKELDTVIVCANNFFTYNTSAIDIDGDQLVYYFGDAYTTDPPLQGLGSDPEEPNGVFQFLPYATLDYKKPYKPYAPMGPGVTIDSRTGIITGVPPVAGHYLVTVYVDEIRNGAVIATQRKDIVVAATSCQIAQARLPLQLSNCDNYTINFQNLSNSPLISNYFWDFGISSVNDDTSLLATPSFVYPDTGIYKVKLIVNRQLPCYDSTTALVKIYPGLEAGFSVKGACLGITTHFQDTSHSKYGAINSWNWDLDKKDLGREPTLDHKTDTFRIPNPSWQYVEGPKTIELIVGNDKGCTDTITKVINIAVKPKIKLAFRDTLICIPDSLQLQASGVGTFNWSPSQDIIGFDKDTAIVHPVATTNYIVELTDGDCSNTDSVKVRVVDHVTLFARADTTICLTDTVRLSTTGDGLLFSWTPVNTINNPTVQSPDAKPTVAMTTYQVTARIGSCVANDQIVVQTVPYPQANAGRDTVICYNTAAQLQGSFNGSSFYWSPPNSLSNTSILNPVATPAKTINYVLASLDTKGCPKPGLDTVTVVVLPKLYPFAGHDTSVVIGQPLQFHASGGVQYQWSPSTGLNNIDIPDPIGLYYPGDGTINYKVIVTDENNCSDITFVKVKVFETNPYVFVPSAFTPDDNGLNDILRPIPVGVSSIKKFSVFNRWGQLVFTTNIVGKGWDGRVNGRLQASNVYVWMVDAIDYKGNPFSLKGTVTLIRK